MNGTDDPVIDGVIDYVEAWVLAQARAHQHCGGEITERVNYRNSWGFPDLVCGRCRRAVPPFEVVPRSEVSLSTEAQDFAEMM